MFIIVYFGNKSGIVYSPILNQRCSCYILSPPPCPPFLCFHTIVSLHLNVFESILSIHFYSLSFSYLSEYNFLFCALTISVYFTGIFLVVLCISKHTSTYMRGICSCIFRCHGHLFLLWIFLSSFTLLLSIFSFFPLVRLSLLVNSNTHENFKEYAPIDSQVGRTGVFY